MLRPLQPPAATKRQFVRSPSLALPRLKRERSRIDSNDMDEMVLREQHPLNRGKRSQYCTGLPGKLYSRYDIVSPISDSMQIMYYRLGWTGLPQLLSEQLIVSSKCARRSPDESLHAAGLGPAPAPQPVPLCKGCRSTDPRDFTPTADKSHLVCKCGVVASMITIAQEREKNCAREDDKTTHADKPYEPKTDRFDHPAQSCEEVRKQRERDAAGTRISKKAKQKLGVGWTQEYAAREAARAERQRQDMDPKDVTKGQNIQIKLDELFTALEPLDNQIKRFCRMEADRAWREAVRHCDVCAARGRCQLRIKEKGAAVIADASLACSINTLVDGKVTLDGVTHAGLLVVANKLGAQQAHKGTSCALRAVRTIVSALQAHSQATPIPSCPVPTKSSCQPSPAPSNSSDASVARPPPSAPFARTDSSVSDVGEHRRENSPLKLRDSIMSVFRYMGTDQTISVRDAALSIVQLPDFRAALDVALVEDEDLSKLPFEGLAVALLDAVSLQISAGSPRKQGKAAVTFACARMPLERLQAATAAVRAILPESLMPLVATEEEDSLFG